MRAIDCGELEKRISSLARLARSDAQKSLLGRVLYIVENMPTLTPQNEPLTLEQLREMDGEPVYDAKYKKWHVIETVGNCFVEMTDGAIFDSDIWCNNLTDRLYRRPPEGEEDT